MPEATPTHVIEALLTLAVLEPTIGCRQYADRLGDQGFSIAKSTVQKHLVAHGLGRRAPAPGPGGGHHGGHDRACDRGGPRGRALRVLPGHRWSGRARLPGQLLHRQAQGRGQGVPAHRHRRLHPLGLRRHRARPGRPAPTPPASSTRLLRHYRRHGIKVRAVLTDNGPEYSAPARSGPTWRPRSCATCASRPARPTTTRSASASTAPSSKSAGARPSTAGTSPRIRQLQAEADAWLITYNHRRRNHGDYMRGRTPHQILDNHRRTRQHDHQPQSPSVTSTLGPEGLVDLSGPMAGSDVVLRRPARSA